jgi:quercetin dioxygenase-like cupin family protein
VSDELDFDRLIRSRSSSCSRIVLELEPGEALEHRDAFWQHAIVFVLAGEIEVCCSRCERHRFVRGNILSLARLELVSVKASGVMPARLLALSGRRPDVRTTR